MIKDRLGKGKKMAINYFREMSHRYITYINKSVCWFFYDSTNIEVKLMSINREIIYKV